MDSYMIIDSDDSQEDKKPIADLYRASVYISSSESEDSLEDYIEVVPVGTKMILFKEGLYSPGSGEICAKYIAMSCSSVLRHAYYNYPSIKDPGIEKALLDPEIKKEYEDNGQELYLDLCKEMKQIPVRIFHRGLITEEIDLRYYGVNPVGVRAMCKALARNMTVKRLNLTSNFLDHIDACYHLGEMLGERNGLRELILSGCKISAKYLRQVMHLLHKRSLDLLDISENKFRDEGIPYLTQQIMLGAVIKKLNLRRNELTSDCLPVLAEVMEFHDHTTHLDLSWNKFYKNPETIQLIRTLRHSQVLVELNMSYTNLSVGTELGALLRIKTLKVLDLKSNRLSMRAAKIIAKNLVLAKSLVFLDLSCNPFLPSDALEVLLSMKDEEVNLKELRMDFIEVNKQFAETLKEIRTLEFRKDTVITHGFILGNYTLTLQDMKVIFLKQLVRLTKKKNFDILVHLLDQNKKRQVLEITEFMRTMKYGGAPVDDEFVTGLSKAFPGPKTEAKMRPLDLDLIVDYIHRFYPEKEPSSTPPPTPPPTPKKKKGKKKKFSMY